MDEEQRMNTEQTTPPDPESVRDPLANYTEREHSIAADRILGDIYGSHIDVTRHVTLTDETGHLRIMMQISGWYRYEPPDTMKLDHLIVFGAGDKSPNAQCRECVEASPMLDEMLDEAWERIRK